MGFNGFKKKHFAAVSSVILLLAQGAQATCSQTDSGPVQCSTSNDVAGACGVCGGGVISAGLTKNQYNCGSGFGLSSITCPTVAAAPPAAAAPNSQASTANVGPLNPPSAAAGTIATPDHYIDPNTGEIKTIDGPGGTSITVTDQDPAPPSTTRSLAAQTGATSQPASAQQGATAQLGAIGASQGPSDSTGLRSYDPLTGTLTGGNPPPPVAPTVDGAPAPGSLAAALQSYKDAGIQTGVQGAPLTVKDGDTASVVPAIGGYDPTIHTMTGTGSDTPGASQVGGGLLTYDPATAKLTGDNPSNNLNQPPVAGANTSDPGSSVNLCFPGTGANCGGGPAASLGTTQTKSETTQYNPDGSVKSITTTDTSGPTQANVANNGQGGGGQGGGGQGGGGNNQSPDDAAAAADKKIDSNTSVTPETAKGGTADAQVGSNDACATGNTINGKYQCNSTKNMIALSKVTTTVATVGSQVTLNAEGQQSQQNLQIQGASQSQAYVAAAQLQNTAAEAQMGLGVVQLAMGGLEQMQSGKLTANGQSIKKNVSAATNPYSIGQTQVDPNNTSQNQFQNIKLTANGSSDDVNNVLSTTKGSEMDEKANAQWAQAGNAYNLKWQQGANEIAAGQANPVQTVGQAQIQAGQLKQKQATQALFQAQTNIQQNARTTARQVAATGISEENNFASQASGQALSDFMHGGTGLALGYLNHKAAEQAEALAAQMGGATGIAPPGADQFNNAPVAPRLPTSITPDSETAPAAQAAAAAPGAPPGSSAGDPFGGGSDGGGGGVGPAPGAFTPAGAGGGAGGGGLTAGGGTSTSPASTDTSADPQAKYAANSGSSSYEGSGGGGLGGGGGKGGGSGDATLSLKDAFAALMNQGKEPKDDQGVDIMSYRKLASDEQYAPLAKSEDFFKYIHTAYQGLQQKGRIGL